MSTRRRINEDAGENSVKLEPPPNKSPLKEMAIMRPVNVIQLEVTLTVST